MAIEFIEKFILSEEHIFSNTVDNDKTRKMSQQNRVKGEILCI